MLRHLVALTSFFLHLFIDFFILILFLFHSLTISLASVAFFSSYSIFSSVLITLYQQLSRVGEPQTQVD